MCIKPRNIWRFWSHNAKGVWSGIAMSGSKVKIKAFWSNSQRRKPRRPEVRTPCASKGSSFTRTGMACSREVPKVQSHGLMCLMCVMVWAYVLYMSMWCIGGFKNILKPYVCWDLGSNAKHLWDLSVSCPSATARLQCDEVPSRPAES